MRQYDVSKSVLRLMFSETPQCGSSNIAGYSRACPLALTNRVICQLALVSAVAARLHCQK